ncbi:MULTISPECIES: NAD(P)/FAD-dependent oxidoreductase [Paenibacillus]|uniref:NAD(P)/FAD-dependent oxidoreductase n=1 Tax=Paenibacillus TaxID=44249 RepID=UPI00203C3EF4|nr:NAD(P)/FAD-dependent oxidoreductase [Paenibacillus camelliae]MCM3631804.1 NAD(P)/FAD-dependent oxidoreductase [Paenibacillus camelliae]
MLYDCAIIGGGPAGLNAALVLGRAKRKVIVLDSGKPRNRVAHESHGYLTRDGIKPAEFRKIANEEIHRYPSVETMQAEVESVSRTKNGFELRLVSGEIIPARKLLLAAGIKEVLPNITGIHEFYGKSLFSCPFCDGWEHRDQPLVLVSDTPHLFHSIKLLYNWSKQLTVCTNGKQILEEEQLNQLRERGIPVIEQSIAAFIGSDGKLEKVRFTDGSQIECSGGMVATQLSANLSFQEELGYESTEMGGIVTDPMGKTTAEGVFAAGDAAYVMPSQLIIAAASGSKAGAAVLADLIEEEWQND